MMTPPLLRRIGRKYRTEGLIGLIRALHRRAQGTPEEPIAVRIRRLVEGKVGLEIGGPSELAFSRRGMIPVYPVAARLDNCNFSGTTIWEGTLKEGKTFRYDEGKDPGRQYICEASDLGGIPSEAYDFCLSSHALEHMANPLKCLEEWLRITKVGGLLVLVVPHRDGTFDRRRPVTPLAHILEDYRRGVGEDDTTHADEIARLHDDPASPITDVGAAREHLERINYRERIMHHHVFCSPSLAEIIDRAGAQLLAVESERPCNIVAVARKQPAGRAPRNGRFLDPRADYRRRSPFPSDRTWVGAARPGIGGMVARWREARERAPGVASPGDRSIP